MTKLSTITVFGKTHVLCPAKMRGTYSGGEKVPMANYRGTGKACCGILKKGETLKKFEKRR